MRKMTIMLISILCLLVGAYAVLAEVVSPTTLTEGTSSKRNLSGLPTQSISAQGGNVTHVNITALSITQSWQGYYGNISGVITLDDGNNNTFYNWTLASTTGEIFATRNSSTDFTTVNCTNTTEISSEETFLGQAASDADSVSNTFSASNNHPAFTVGSVSIGANNCSATNAFGASGAQTSEYFQILLSDDSSNTVYTTLINDSGSGFDGNSWDFELMVGENEHSGSEGATTYFFFVELN